MGIKARARPPIKHFDTFLTNTARYCVNVYIVLLTCAKQTWAQSFEDQRRIRDNLRSPSLIFHPIARVSNPALFCRVRALFSLFLRFVLFSNEQKYF